MKKGTSSERKARRRGVGGSVDVKLKHSKEGPGPSFVTSVEKHRKTEGTRGEKVFEKVFKAWIFHRRILSGTADEEL